MNIYKPIKTLMSLLLYFVTLPKCFAATLLDYKFEQLTIEEGLSQTTVYAITQDTRGFLWFGTEDGLNRYDGHNFKIYGNNVLHDSSILSIVAAGDETIWIGTEASGLSRLNTLTDEIVRYTPSAASGSISHNKITSLFIDSQQLLWVGTDGGGLNLFNNESNSFRIFTYKSENLENLCSNNITTITEDQDANLWIGTKQSGICYYNKQQQVFHRIQYGATTKKGLSVNSIYFDKSAKAWIGTSNGIFEYHPKAGLIHHYKHDENNPNSISNNIIKAFIEDKQGNIWVGTSYNLNILNPRTHNNIRVMAKYLDSNTLSDNHITQFHRDYSGVLWIGTHSGGINKYNSRKSVFNHISKKPDKKNSLSNPFVWAIKKAYGYLWMGTENGLNRYNPDTGEFTHYNNKELQQKDQPNNHIRSIVADNHNGLWIGMVNGLSYFNIHTGKFHTYIYKMNNTDEKSINYILSMTMDEDKKLWIGTQGGGVNIFNIQTKKFSNIKHNPNDSNSLPNNFVYGTDYDSSGFFWFMTLGGIGKYNIKTKEFTHYTHSRENPNSLIDNNTGSIYRGDNGIYWFGTDKGLSRFDSTTETFRSFSNKNGLANDFIYAIQKDNSGFIWVSTNKGLSRINPKTYKIKNFDSSDGLQSNEFNSNAQENDGSRLYFGGINGVTVFNPEDIEFNNYIPPVTITAFKVFDEYLPLPSGESAKQAINISYKENFFSIEFAVLDYASPHKNQYAYMLEGFDRDWIYSGNRRYANYTNLDGGHYTFKVKGANGEGVWNEKGASVNIHISSTPWKSWWAYTLYTLLLIISVYLIIRFRTLAESTLLADRLRRMSNLLTQSLDMNIIVTTLTDHLSQIIPYNQAIIFFKTENHYKCHKIRTLSSKTIKKYDEDDKNKIIEVIEAHNQPVCISKSNQTHPITFKNPDWQNGSLLGIPLIIQEKVAGVIILFNRRQDSFRHDVVNIAITLVMQAGVAVENARLFNETKRLAFFDTLTGLENRRLFKDRLEQALINSQRKNSEVGLLFLDLDQFKRINDTLGHDAGDALLQKVAIRLKKSVRQQDTVARIGGDEFTILLSEVNGITGCDKVARNILQELQEPIYIDNHEVMITTSIGISIAPKDCIDANDLMKNADLAMYRAKELGRNNYQFFSDEMNVEASRHLFIENELRQAVSKKEFELYYQPIVDINTDVIYSMEALIRWQHPVRGMISPSFFIPKAEEMGFIVKIGEWVILQACKQAKAIQNAELPPVKVAVNLSAQQLRSKNIRNTIMSCLQESALDPCWLKIEITETILIEDIEQNLKTLHELKNLGLTIAIDDFGTGYSSLSYLKRLPIDIVKVDRSFVMDIPHDPDDIEITAAVIAMAHKLNLQVVAEGVETTDQLDFLRQNQCDYAQGFLFSKPIKGENIIQFLRKSLQY